MRRRMVLITLIAASIATGGCNGPNEKEKLLSNFIEARMEKAGPLEKQAALAYWQAAVTGDDAEYDRAGKLTFRVRKIFSSRGDFAMIADLKENGRIEDPLLERQLTVLYNRYLRNQIDEKLLSRMVELSTKIEQKFSTHRGTIAGEQVTANQIKQILKTETDSQKRKAAWLASKQVAPVIADDLIALVKLRNRGARRLGFDSYHTLSLVTTEQEVEAVDAIFAELYELTQKPFAEMKAELDAILAKKYNVSVEDLRPWHYHDPFFQETPMIYDLDLDAYYRDKDVKTLGEAFYAGIGLPVDAIMANSDLYERQGKNPHAFCTDIDREGDVRILCNLVNNEAWMETLLHELGHAVYDKYNDPGMPYLLREPAHAFTTEAVAMFFGRLSRNPAWMQDMLGLSDVQRAEIEIVGDRYARMKQLIFARWAMVMYEFEKALYANPRQDLNTLWWDMVEKYQMVHRPDGRDEPDWAAKIHFAIAPCYYHNYMLGELLASQMHHHLVHDVLRQDTDEEVSYVGREKAGRWFRQNIFAPGDRYHWNEMIARATGEPLTAKYFAEQFVKNSND